VLLSEAAAFSEHGGVGIEADRVLEELRVGW
jgi:hypothetical protein